MTSYKIHDNGGRPFLVAIDGLSVDISKIVYDSDDEHHYEHILQYDTKRVFVGKSPLNGMTGYSGGYGEKFDGNSILLHLGDLKYVFIGKEIYQFRALAEIVKYKSPVGNNDVPYPWARDSKQNIYLMIENIVILNTPQNERNMNYYDDPYDYYYDARHIIPTPRYIDKIKTATHYKSKPVITEWGLGNNVYDLTYQSDAAKNYDRLMDFDEGDMYYLDADGERHHMSKDQYVKLMRKFGKRMGFMKISNKVIVQERLW